MPKNSAITFEIDERQIKRFNKEILQRLDAALQTVSYETAQKLLERISRSAPVSLGKYEKYRESAHIVKHKEKYGIRISPLVAVKPTEEETEETKEVDNEFMRDVLRSEFGLADQNQPHLREAISYSKDQISKIWKSDDITKLFDPREKFFPQEKEATPITDQEVVDSHTFTKRLFGDIG